MKLHPKDLYDHEELLRQIVAKGYCGEGVRYIAQQYLTAISYTPGLEVLEIYNPEVEAITDLYYLIANEKVVEDQFYLPEEVIVAFVEKTVDMQILTATVIDSIADDEDPSLSRVEAIRATQTISYLLASGFADAADVEVVAEAHQLYYEFYQAFDPELLPTHKAIARELKRAVETADVSEYKYELIRPRLVLAFRVLISDMSQRIEEMPYVSGLPNLDVEVSSHLTSDAQYFLRGYASIVGESVTEVDGDEAEQQDELADKKTKEYEAQARAAILAEEEALRKTLEAADDLAKQTSLDEEEVAAEAKEEARAEAEAEVAAELKAEKAEDDLATDEEAEEETTDDVGDGEPETDDEESQDGDDTDDDAGEEVEEELAGADESSEDAEDTGRTQAELDEAIDNSKSGMPPAKGFGVKKAKE